MARVSDFSTNSFIGENILRALRNCDEGVLSELRKGKFLTQIDTRYVLTSKCLKYKHMERYAQAANVPLTYFFFKTDTPPIPHYTPYDADVIGLLNSMATKQLTTMKRMLLSYFFNNLMVCDEPTPNKRIGALFQSNLHGNNSTPDKPCTPDAANLVLSLDTLLAMRHFNYRLYFYAQTDCFLELAKFTGVSLYWIFDFHNLPLFCRTALADEVFSLYTLIQPNQRPLFIKMLNCVALK